jgi:hypothetical protein
MGAFTAEREAEWESWVKRRVQEKAAEVIEEAEAERVAANEDADMSEVVR